MMCCIIGNLLFQSRSEHEMIVFYQGGVVQLNHSLYQVGSETKATMKRLNEMI